MPNPYAGSSASMSPASFRGGGRTDLVPSASRSESNASLPQLQISLEGELDEARKNEQRLQEGKSSLLFQAPEDAAVQYARDNPRTRRVGGITTPDTDKDGRRHRHQSSTSSTASSSSSSPFNPPPASVVSNMNSPPKGPPASHNPRGKGWIAHQSVLPSISRAEPDTVSGPPTLLASSGLTPSPVSYTNNSRLQHDDISPPGVAAPHGDRRGRYETLQSRDAASSTSSLTDASYLYSRSEASQTDGFSDPNYESEDEQRQDEARGLILDDEIAGLQALGVEVPEKLEILDENERRGVVSILRTYHGQSPIIFSSFSTRD